MEQFGKQIELAYQEHYYLILSLRAGAGILLGLIPLILGIKKGKRNLGILGFIVSIIVGLIAPILLIVSVPIFIWLILRKPAEIKPSEVEAANEKPVDGAVEDSQNSSDSKNEISGD